MCAAKPQSVYVSFFILIFFVVWFYIVHCPLAALLFVWSTSSHSVLSPLLFLLFWRFTVWNQCCLPPQHVYVQPLSVRGIVVTRKSFAGSPYWNLQFASSDSLCCLLWCVGMGNIETYGTRYLKPVRFGNSGGDVGCVVVGFRGQRAHLSRTFHGRLVQHASNDRVPRSRHLGHRIISLCKLHTERSRFKWKKDAGALCPFMHHPTALRQFHRPSTTLQQWLCTLGYFSLLLVALPHHACTLVEKWLAPSSARYRRGVRLLTSGRPLSASSSPGESATVAVETAVSTQQWRKLGRFYGANQVLDAIHTWLPGRETRWHGSSSSTDAVGGASTVLRLDTASVFCDFFLWSGCFLRRQPFHMQKAPYHVTSWHFFCSHLFFVSFFDFRLNNVEMCNGAFTFFLNLFSHPG